MNLIEHHDTVSQTPEAHKLMLDVQDRKQGLIDRAHAVFRKQGAFAMRKVRTCNNHFVFFLVNLANHNVLIRFFQKRRTVKQL